MVNEVKLVEVRWLDAVVSDSRLVDLNDLSRITLPRLTHSVGYVIMDDEEFVTLAGNLCADERGRVASNIITIPRKSIVKVSELLVNVLDLTSEQEIKSNGT